MECGNGGETKIRFWHDLWCVDHPLKESFMELFSIACCKEAWVADNMQVSNYNLRGTYLLLDLYKIERSLCCLHFL